MGTSSIAAPIFSKDQSVEFIGGTGKIKNYHLELGGWVYLVEMAMGSEPICGRVGSETTIVLPELEMYLTRLM